MQELVTQVSYICPVRQNKVDPRDTVVATFSCQHPLSERQTWGAKIEKVSLKTAAEIIFTFFNSQHAQKATSLNVFINGQKVFLSKSDTAQTADYYLSSLASNFQLE